MAESFLSRVQGFTPVIDVLAAELGIVTAAVYGVAWRYCQGPHGVCSASMERIGAHLSLDRRTVERHMRRLVEEGYLEDLTPGLRNRPHTYADTGRAEIEGLVEARVHRREAGGGTENTTEVDGGGTENATEVVQKVPPDARRCDRKYHQGGAESTMKRERDGNDEETIGDGVVTGVGPPGQPRLDLPEPVTEAVRLWAGALEVLQRELPPPTYDTWVRKTYGLLWEDGVLVVGVQSAYTKDWLENRLYGPVQRTVAAIAGRPTSVRFIIRRNSG